MAAKKKTSKKPAKSTAKKTSGKKKAVKKLRKKSAVSKRKATRTPAKKKPARKKKPAATKKTKKTVTVRRRATTRPARMASPGEQSRWRSAVQSGDAQGLSGRAGADSQSVDELVEEGNAFEADVVTGVEAAHDQRREVRTREVPEDDVPQEYLDED